MTGDVARQMDPRDPRERNFQLPLAALALLPGVWLGAHTQPGLWVLWLALVAGALAFALHSLHLPWLGALLPVVLALGTILLVASVVLVTLAEVLRRRARHRTQQR